LTELFTTIGTWFEELALPLHFLLLAVFLGLILGVIQLVKRLHPYRGQLMVLAGIFWVFLVFYFITYTFPVPRGILVGMTPGSTIPRLWFYSLLPVIVLTLIPIFRNKEEVDPKWGNMRLIAIVFTVLVISVGLFNFIGYYISSALFIVTVMWILGSRNKVELIAVPAGWIVFSYLVFARLLSVRLPVGSIIENIIG